MTRPGCQAAVITAGSRHDLSDISRIFFFHLSFSYFSFSGIMPLGAVSLLQQGKYDYGIHNRIGSFPLTEGFGIVSWRYTIIWIISKGHRSNLLCEQPFPIGHPMQFGSLSVSITIFIFYSSHFSSIDRSISQCRPR